MPLFAPLSQFIAMGIWGDAREIQGDTIVASADGRGEILGAAIFQNYRPEYGTVEISAAANSSRWLTRAVLFEMFSYAFDQLQCQAVVLLCDPANAVMQRIAGAYGFKRYEIPRLRGRDKAETVHVLADDDWRKNGYHKEHAHG